MWSPKLERTQNERRKSARAQRHRGQRSVHSQLAVGGGEEKVVHFRGTSLPLPLLLYLLEHPVKEEPSVLQKRDPTRPHFSKSPCPQSTLSYLNLNDYVLNPHLSRQTPGAPPGMGPICQAYSCVPGPGVGPGPERGFISVSD